MISRAAELSRARAGIALSEEDCLIWFGVGQATLERIESGEVEPTEETAHRIDRYLQLCGGDPFPLPQSTAAPAAACPDHRFTHAGGPTAEGAPGFAQRLDASSVVAGGGDRL